MVLDIVLSESGTDGAECYRKEANQGKLGMRGVNNKKLDEKINESIIW